MNTLISVVLLLAVLNIQTIIYSASISRYAIQSAVLTTASVSGPQIASGFIGFFGRGVEERFRFDGDSERTIIENTFHKLYNGAMMGALFASSFYLAKSRVPEYVAFSSGLMSMYWYAAGRVSNMRVESEKSSPLFMRSRDIPSYVAAILFLGLFPECKQYVSCIARLSMIGSAFTLSALPE